MDNLDDLKKFLRTNDIFFEEIIADDILLDKLPNTTLVVNKSGELWAFKLHNKTKTLDILIKLATYIHFTHLNISDCALTQLPTSLQSLTNLQTLNISFNGLSSLPDWLQSLTNLQTLNISGNDLSSLPDWLQSLTNLQTLNISFNDLSSLPDWLQSLTNLQTLNISDNGLSSLPDWLQSLTNLQTLNISGNGLSSLPDWLQKLTNLQTLHISFNGLSSLPDWLQSLTNLQTLHISFNGLSSLPDWLQKLTSLQTLNISGNGLKFLPDWLQKLTSLQTLNISGNGLKFLPDWLQKLTSLQTLHISGNGLKFLPDWLQKLTSLQTLDISGNGLKFLPDWLQKLTSLQTLNISFNPFQTLPHIILPFLQAINVSIDDVAIDDVPSTTVKQGWDTIAQYYAAIGHQKKSSLAELKVMIIGDGSSGKSCISKVLKEKDQYKHDPEEKSTVGIELRDIKHTFGTEKWVLRMWDFGGQEAYAATQTLFMTDETLYLIVIDARSEKRPDHYLHYVKTFAPNSPIILIINKIDENERFDLNRPLYLDEIKYPHVHSEIIRFSCKKEDRKRYETDLFRAIETVLNNGKYKLREKQWPHSWRVVKDALMTRLATTNNTYVTGADYDAICAECQLQSTHKETVRKDCNTLGVIFSYTNKNPMSPVDWIMHPDWVTKGINYLFGLDVGGFYETEKIFKHMRQHKYDDEEIRAILTMLKREKLAYDDESSDQYFIPALLSADVSTEFIGNDKWSIPEESQVVDKINSEIRFRYPALPHRIKQTFMVNLYRNNKKNLSLYRYGACWMQDNVRIVMMEDNNDLVFYLQGDSNSVLHNARIWVQDKMKEINNSINIEKCDVIHVFRKNDANGNPQFDERNDKNLRRLLTSGRAEKIWLENTDQIISLKKLLKDYEPTTNEATRHMTNVTNNTYNGTVYDQRESIKPIGINEGTINYALNNVSYSELQDFLQKFLEAQKFSSEIVIKGNEKVNLTGEEETKIKDIINTQKPAEGKSKFKNLITSSLPSLNVGDTVLNLSTALINFSNAHPNAWTGVKAVLTVVKTAMSIES
ncbi:MAG: leucine-rich repeat domain-containing protein [Candidatus Bathyarchaeota archaeon]|nr:leucine-rich repeat domain-containing protein [Candidatus Termiticorpusculum sp.]